MIKINKKKLKKRVMVLAAIVAIIVLVSLSASKVLQLAKDKAEAQEMLLILEKEKARLEEELKRVDSDEYIEQQAREQLNMIMPGETLYVLKDGDEDEEVEDEEE